MRIPTIIATLFFVALLQGCAAQWTYREGKELLAQDKVEEGLAKIREAMENDPATLEYKEAFLQNREASVFRITAQADQALESGKRDDADALYRRALAIDPNSPRARAGLINVDRSRRHEDLLKEAEAALAKKDTVTARLKISAILAEDPRNEKAHKIESTLSQRQPEKPSTEVMLAEAYKKRISLDFKDAPLKQIFDVISHSAHLNFIFDKDVKLDQKTSLYLKNSSIESAIHYMLMTNQLEQQVLDGNSIMIFPNTASKQKDYQNLVIKTFFLTNAEAKTVANTLKNILKTRDLVVDEKLNALIMRDSPQSIRLAEKLVALEDVAEPEVMLEVEVLEVTRTRLLELGIQWPGSMTLTPLSRSAAGTSGSSTGTSTSSSSSTTSSSSGSSSLTLYDLIHRNNNTIGVGISPVTVKANSNDGDANILANPRIRARNHEKAKILIGQRVPNITSTATSTGFISESINYVDVGMTLNVEPTIYLNNDVAIKVALEVSNIVNQISTQSGTVAYQIGTRTASTMLQLKDGENQVLAGLINDEDRRSSLKVPAFGDIPILGKLFGTSSDNAQKTEIVLSITPHIVRNIQRPEAALTEFDSGTENSLRQRPESGGDASSIQSGSHPATETPKTLPQAASPQTTNPARSSTNSSAPTNMFKGIGSFMRPGAFGGSLPTTSGTPTTSPKSTTP